MGPTRWAPRPTRCEEPSMRIVALPSPVGRGRAGNAVHGRVPAFAAALSLTAAIAHFQCTPEHFRSWWAYGLFFLAAGAGQAAYCALVLWRPVPSVAMLGIVGNLAIIGMYVLSRTNGVPLGPHAGRAQAPTLLDFTTTAVELVLV